MTLRCDRRAKHWSLKSAAVYVAGGLAFILPGCGRDQQRLPPVPKITAVPVSVVAVEKVRLAGSRPVTGTIRPFEHALVATRIMGTVRDASFAVGQPVSAGDVLVTIHADELKTRLERARAALNQAMRDLSRETTLLAQGSSTQEIVRTAEDQLKVAKADFEEARILMRYARIIAPFSGFITRKLVNTGDFALPGTPLLELEAGDRMRAELDVPETLISQAVGADVRVESSKGTITGRISEISPAVDASTRTRRVIVDLPSEAIVHSGEFVRAFWPTGEWDGLFVPVQAIGHFGQIEQVFVVEQSSRTVLRFVKTGIRQNNRVQILSGVVAGEKVVVNPPASLRDGHPVRVQP